MIEKIKTKTGHSYRARINWVDATDRQKTFKRKNDAQAWERTQLQERDQIRATGILVQDDVTFSFFTEKWMSEKVKLQLAPSSQAAYEIYLRLHLLPVLESVKMKGISLQHAHRVVLAMRSKKLTPQTINSAIGTLQGILNEAVNWGYLHRNPLATFKPLKEEPRAETFWLASEIDQFLRANLRSPLYPLWVVALNTGMRRGEIGALKWDRVSFQRKQIEVTRSVSRYGLVERTKTRIKRVVPMNDIVLRTLWPLWQSQRSEFVFSREEGKPLNMHHIYRDFCNAQKAAGIINQIRFHDVRHTFASHFMMNGGNLYDLQKILGHTNSKMTERYAHLSPTHLEKAIQVVSFGTALEGIASEENPKPPFFLHGEGNGQKTHLISVS